MAEQTFTKSLDKLTDNDIKLLAAAFLHLKDKPNPDWNLVAKEVDSKSAESCSVRYRTLKRKINEDGTPVPAGDMDPTTPSKATPKNRKSAQVKSEADEDGATPKKRGRKSNKEKDAEAKKLLDADEDGATPKKRGRKSNKEKEAEAKKLLDAQEAAEAKDDGAVENEMDVKAELSESAN